MQATDLNRLDLVTSLGSTRCPSCGNAKRSKQTFCGTCYFKLAGPARMVLYHKLGHGYEAAVAAAMTALGRTEFCCRSG